MKSHSKNVVFALVGCAVLAGGAWAQESVTTSPSDSATTESTNTGTSQGDMAGTVTPSTAQKKTMSMEEMKRMKPREVCDRLVQAAKKDDFALANQWTYELAGSMPSESQAGTAGGEAMSGQPSGSPESMNGLSREQLASFKDLNCGSERIAGDHAFVEVKGKDQSRFIPFVKDTSGIWKFDARTYMSFYRNSMMSSSG